MKLKKYKDIITIMQSERDDIIKSETAKSQKIYEDKVRVLDEKLQQITKAQNDHASIIANQHVVDKVKQIEASYNNKLDKYKNAISAIADREKELEQTLHTLKEKYNHVQLVQK